MNKIIIVGNVSQEPTIKENYVSINVAIKRNYKDQDGNYGADFVWFTAFRQRAEYIGSYINKGDLVSIVGHISTTDKKSQDGKFLPPSHIIDDISRLKKASQNNDEQSGNNPFGAKMPTGELEENLPF